MRHRRLPAQDEHARPGPAGQGRHASPPAAPRAITPFFTPPQSSHTTRRPPPPQLRRALLTPSAPADEADIIDEVIGFFKANTLFKQFQPQGAGDRLLIYLTLYITECLKIIEKCATPVDAMKQLTSKAHESFKIPGDAGFALGSFYPGPTTSQEADLCRGYLKQAREEIGRRLIEKVYVDGAPSKFWTTFAKRKFMNKAL